MILTLSMQIMYYGRLWLPLQDTSLCAFDLAKRWKQTEATLPHTQETEANDVTFARKSRRHILNNCATF